MIAQLLAYLRGLGKRYYSVAEDVLRYLDMVDTQIEERNFTQAHIAASNLRVALLHLPMVAAVDKIRKAR